MHKKSTKPLLSVLAAALTLTLLTSCSSVPGMSSGSTPNSSSGRNTPSTSSTPSSGTSNPAASSGHSSGDDLFYVGDTVSTTWFDFTVDSVESTHEYEGYSAQDGNKLLVVQLSLQSTVPYSSDMWQDDFVVGWEDETDEEYGFDYVEPLSAYCEAQFPDEYTLKINESRTGILVYEVSEEHLDFWINFLEVFEDDEYGESYFIYFSAE